eukprot:534608-Alexandrium_andersonii.AAC.1
MSAESENYDERGGPLTNHCGVGRDGVVHICLEEQRYMPITAYAHRVCSWQAGAVVDFRVDLGLLPSPLP